MLWGVTILPGSPLGAAPERWGSYRLVSPVGATHSLKSEQLGNAARMCGVDTACTSVGPLAGAGQRHKKWLRRVSQHSSTQSFSCVTTSE